MGRKKDTPGHSTIEVENVTMVATFVCPKCKNSVDVQVGQYDFSYSSSECDICGSHDSLKIYKTCPICKEYIEISIISN